MRTVGITGGTGFVGHYLTKLLVQNGYEVVIFTRSAAEKSGGPNVSFAHWHMEKGECDNGAIRRLDAMVHLAGAGIADKRWTEARKKEIADSRIKVTEFLVGRLKEYGDRCKVFVSASAIGYYGADKGAQPFTEEDKPANDFLGTTCRLWEEQSRKAEQFVRTVIMRFGIVLGKESGAFPKLAAPMSFGVMPVLGSGRQVVSWIEVNDLARMLLFVIEHSAISGVYNAVAPHPVSHKEMMKTIASAKGGLKIPAPAPAFMLQLLMGEMSEEVLKSCTVSADKITAAGFTFSNPDVLKASKAILGKG